LWRRVAAAATAIFFMAQRRCQAVWRMPDPSGVPAGAAALNRIDRQDVRPGAPDADASS